VTFTTRRRLAGRRATVLLHECWKAALPLVLGGLAALAWYLLTHGGNP
jgi:hypothetical protein